MRLGRGKKKGQSKTAADAADSAPAKPRKKEKKPKEKRPKPVSRGRGIAIAKPQMNLDTALLGIAVLAITFGCLLLLMEIYRFGGFGAIKGPV